MDYTIIALNARVHEISALGSGGQQTFHVTADSDEEALEQISWAEPGQTILVSRRGYTNVYVTEAPKPRPRISFRKVM